MYYMVHGPYITKGIRQTFDWKAPYGPVPEKYQSLYLVEITLEVRFKKKTKTEQKPEKKISLWPET